MCGWAGRRIRRVEQPAECKCGLKLAAVHPQRTRATLPTHVAKVLAPAVHQAILVVVARVVVLAAVVQQGCSQGSMQGSGLQAGRQAHGRAGGAPHATVVAAVVSAPLPLLGRPAGGLARVTGMRKATKSGGGLRPRVPQGCRRPVDRHSGLLGTAAPGHPARSRTHGQREAANQQHAQQLTAHGAAGVQVPARSCWRGGGSEAEPGGACRGVRKQRSGAKAAAGPLVGAAAPAELAAARIPPTAGCPSNADPGLPRPLHL